MSQNSLPTMYGFKLCIIWKFQKPQKTVEQGTGKIRAETDKVKQGMHPYHNAVVIVKVILHRSIVPVKGATNNLYSLPSGASSRRPSINLIKAMGSCNA